jgi:hypothetical protein
MRIIRLPGHNIAKKVEENIVDFKVPARRQKITITNCTIDLSKGSVKLPTNMDVEFIGCTFISSQDNTNMFSYLSSSEEESVEYRGLYADYTNSR